MKRYFKITNRMQVAIILLCTLIGQPLLSYADNLSAYVELRDNNELFIKNILIVEGDRLYVLHKNQLPDSLLICGIDIKYEGHIKDTLKIDTLFSTVVKNDVLTQSEIKDANGGKDLFLSLGNLYSFTYGGKEWKLNLEKGSASESESNTSDSNNSQKKDSLFIIALVEGCVIFVLLMFLFRKKIEYAFKKEKGQGSKEKDKQNNPGTSSKQEEDNTQEKQEHQTSQKNIEQKIRDIYCKLCPNSEGKSVEDMLDYILMSVIPSVKTHNDTLDTIKGLLGIKEKEDDIIIKKIKDLLDKQGNPSQQSENEIKEKFAKSLLDTIKSTSDKELKQMIEKAEKGCSKKEDIISKLLQDLRGKTITSGHTQKQITEEQLTDSNNGSILAHWIIDQITSCGYGSIDIHSSTPQEIFSAIAKKLDAAGQEVEEALLNKLRKEFPNLVGNTTDETIKKIKNKVDEANKLAQEKEGKEQRISELEKERKELLSSTKTMVDKLHSYAEGLGNMRPPILSPCRGDVDMQQCKNIEEGLYNSLSQVVDELKALSIPLDTSPATARKTIQDKLVEIMGQQDNAITTICRYYAYSRLPFMTDNKREFGKIFNRQNMSKLYEAVNNLFVSFGISFDIPALFVMGINEGDYEDKSGQAHRELDNLCPNSCNHIDKIDSDNKPAKVIIDIANVGYSVDGERKMKTSVLAH